MSQEPTSDQIAKDYAVALAIIDRLRTEKAALLAACQTLIKSCSKRDGTLATYEEWIQCFVEDGSTLTECVETATSAIAKCEATS